VELGEKQLVLLPDLIVYSTANHVLLYNMNKTKTRTNIKNPAQNQNLDIVP